MPVRFSGCGGTEHFPRIERRSRLDAGTASFTFDATEARAAELSLPGADPLVVSRSDTRRGAGAYDLDAHRFELSGDVVIESTGLEARYLALRGEDPSEAAEQTTRTSGAFGIVVDGAEAAHHGSFDDRGRGSVPPNPLWREIDASNPTAAMAAALREAFGLEGAPEGMIVAGPLEVLRVLARSTGPATFAGDVELDGRSARRFTTSASWSDLALETLDPARREDARASFERVEPGSSARLDREAVAVEVVVGDDGFVSRVRYEADGVLFSSIAVELMGRADDRERTTAATFVRQFDLRDIGKPQPITLPAR